MEAGRDCIARLKSVLSLSAVPSNTSQNSEKGPGAKNGKINSSERMFEEKLAIFSMVKITEELRIGKSESKRKK